MDQPAEGPLERADGPHGHRVHHLLVEMGVAVRWREPVLSQQVRPVQVHRFVELLPVLVLVHDLDVFARRPRLELLPREAQGHLVHDRRLEPGGQAGVHGEHPELAEHGRG